MAVILRELIQSIQFMAYSVENTWPTAWLDINSYYIGTSGIRTSDLPCSMITRKQVPCSYPQVHSGSSLMPDNSNKDDWQLYAREDKPISNKDDWPL